MKPLPPIITPEQAKQLSENDEAELDSAIASVNNQLRKFDGTSVVRVRVARHGPRVRDKLMEMIHASGWLTSNIKNHENTHNRAVEDNIHPYRSISVSEDVVGAIEFDCRQTPAWEKQS